jgi:hypothetical protein
MLTIATARAETRTVSIDALPATVLSLVGEAENLPRWAPGFARAVRASGDEWVVDNGEVETRIIMRVSREHGTVDILRAEDPLQGAYSRVLPNGAGSEYQFTILFPEGTPDAVVAQQMSNVEEELAVVRKLSESLAQGA